MMASDLRACVRFRERCVFAGEELACTITFKNVADAQLSTPTGVEGARSSRRNSISQLAAISIRGRRGAHNPRVVETFGRGQMNSHRATMSLSTPLSAASDVPSPISLPLHGTSYKHHRSISIISGPMNAQPKSSNESTAGGSTQPALEHSRSSSVNATHGKRNGSIGAAQQSSLQVPTRKGSGVRPLAKSLHEREISDASVADSNRSSTEFHSLSNHSQETLISEQPSVLSDVPQFHTTGDRQHYHMGPTTTKTSATAKLLMAYAQVNGAFTLDSSLVDASPFEDVKRQGFLGGQAGGGVVGVKKPRPGAGFFGGFGLNNISESIGSLMSGSELSSVNEMKAVASSRAIPLLSTPQSLLFVDLQLAPGEERSFSFSYEIPKGLPSSHRGKAIRISYDLIIGLQGAPGARDVQVVRHVKVPLRVFSGVNQEGEILGHDLMQPHVVLRDSAKTAPVESGTHFPPIGPTLSASTIDASTKDFLRYTDNLLDKSKRRQSSSGTLATLSQNTGDVETQTAKGAINRAVLYSNQVAGTGDASPNRFDIARGGLHVAVVSLDRPLHRLGETVTAAIDFSVSDLPCLNLRATLETTEKVNPALAVRSATSIGRVTRKVYAAHSENTLYARRVVFCPNIPVTATPTLLTSGVNLDWSLRFEFGTVRLPSTLEGEVPDPSEIPELMEEIAADERGSISAAVETIQCESFEVVIPITVFGDVVMDKENDDEVISQPI